jgi:hypothetical protein
MVAEPPPLPPSVGKDELAPPLEPEDDGWLEDEPPLEEGAPEEPPPLGGDEPPDEPPPDGIGICTPPVLGVDITVCDRQPDTRPALKATIAARLSVSRFMPVTPRRCHTIWATRPSTRRTSDL